MKVKVLELFAGIGACSKALTNLGIEHEIVDAVEIDKYAIKSFNAIHNTNFEPQDITKWNKDIDCDLIMHGSPCQDFSVAGRGAGGDEGSGTRSSLLYESLRIIEKLHPKYVIWENVKNLLSKKHRHNFDAYLESMEKLGYKNYYQVLNAKNYGIPQNRERVFTVSILDNSNYAQDETICLNSKGGRNGIDGLQPSRKDRIYDANGLAATVATSDFYNPLYLIKENKTFAFPQPVPLGKKLKDVLEKEVNEKYYVSDKQLHGMAVTNYASYKLSKLLKDDNEIADTLKARFEGCPQMISNNVVDKSIIENFYRNHYLPIRTANKIGYDLAKDGDGIDLSYPKSTTRRGRVGHEVSKTLPTSDSQGVLDGFRIRKLTPKECWRLMGFDDSDYDKASKVCSETQLYKQAGNSIVVNVLQAILKELLNESNK